ncbi:MAG: hypothetical protein E3J43_07255 [Candidatus Heimdallarchaeota archaeon]|nr:MAG: hypothetical protein E3J43_07255 [Candidatus Heimdallarchaeota archaeon]
MSIEIQTSNRDYIVIKSDPHNSLYNGTQVGLGGTAIVDMDTNDTAVLAILVDNGTKVVDVFTATRFTGALIC